mmetsp:Transcript_25746/g.53378  ORF Transcript_25746/g.53378 Transcript_25746/m.53378 type:complete len:363 (-) Transcript_25746:639-1727(-)
MALVDDTVALEQSAANEQPAEVDLKAELRRPAQAGFRNYESSAFQSRVERTYFDIQSRHTVEGVRAKLAAYRKLDKAAMSVQDMMRFLDTIVDESDPDNDLPQSYHAYQTAESVFSRYFGSRESLALKDVALETFFTAEEWAKLPGHAQRMYHGKTLATHLPHIEDWSWFPLVGLLHDLGKVCMEEGFGSMPQWSAVGDTFVVGCDFDPANIFAEKGFHKSNPDADNSAFQGRYGIYKPNCGLKQLLLSFGHDEYLALVLEGHAEAVEQRKAIGEEVPVKQLPKEAIYMVRFHSFYPWHTPRGNGRGYLHLASKEDWRLLPLVKALQKSDLYSKTKDLPDIEELQAFYGKLIQEHFLPSLRW